MKNEDFAAKLEAMKLEIQKQSAIHESQVAYFARSEAHMTEMEDFKEKTVQSYEDYVLYRTCNDRDQLVMYEANFISVFILTLCRRLGLKTDGLDNKGSDPDHCSDRYKTAWQIFKPISKAETWLKKTGLDFKYYQKLKNVDNVSSIQSLDLVFGASRSPSCQPMAPSTEACMTAQEPCTQNALLSSLYKSQD